MQQQELISLYVLRPVRATTTSVDAPTSRARWWSSVMTRCPQSWHLLLQRDGRLLDSLRALQLPWAPVNYGAWRVPQVQWLGGHLCHHWVLPQNHRFLVKILNTFIFFPDIYWNGSRFKPFCALWRTKVFALFDQNINVTLDSIKYIYCVISRSLWLQNWT